MPPITVSRKIGTIVQGVEKKSWCGDRVTRRMSHEDVCLTLSRRVLGVKLPIYFPCDLSTVKVKVSADHDRYSQLDFCDRRSLPFALPA